MTQQASTSQMLAQPPASTGGARRSRFLDLKAIAALEHLKFTTRQRVEGAYSGQHVSRQLGGAGEFADYREYVDGEDLRWLDWKVLGRTGRSYIRLFQDETNLICTLAIDTSGSMRFGDITPGGSKLDYAKFLATAMSHVIVRQQDQVGLALISDGLREHLAPGGTPSHAAVVQSAIEQAATMPNSDLHHGLRVLFERSPRRGALILVSDFLMENLEETFAAVRLFRHRHWEVVTLHLVHPDEERLPAGAAYRFEGLENEGLVNCSPEEIRAAYSKRFAAHCATVRKLAIASGCDYRRVSTEVPYLRTLAGFLVDRMK